MLCEGAVEQLFAFYWGLDMINLIAKHWIVNYKEYQDRVVRQKYGILCGIVGICLNICLFAWKLLAGWLSQSIAITADAFNNL